MSKSVLRSTIDGRGRKLVLLNPPVDSSCDPRVKNFPSMSSLFERDYILRLVKQLAALLAAILKLKKDKKYDQALEHLQGAFPSLFGIEYRTLVAVDSASAAELLNHAAKLKILAQLLNEEADIYRSRGDDAVAAAKQVHALELYIEAAQRSSEAPEISAAIASISGKVQVADLGAKYRVWLQLQADCAGGRPPSSSS